MARKRHKPEEIVAELRQVEVPMGQGQTVTEATYYRWRAACGGLKHFEQESGRLRRAISDLTLEKLILKGETVKRVNASGNF